MAVIQSGVSATDIATVDPTRKAIRVSIRHQEVGTGGSYKLSMSGTPNAGLGGSSEIFQFKNPDSNKLCIIERIDLLGGAVTTAFAAGSATFNATIARAWSTSLGSTLSGNTNKLATSESTSIAQFAVVATTALSAGTKTLDTNPFWSMTFGVPATNNITLIGSLNVIGEQDMAHPIILAQNEGFAIRATVPATGVYLPQLVVRWTEILATAY